MMLFWMKTSARSCGKIDNQHMSESFFDLCFLHAPNELGFHLDVSIILYRSHDLSRDRKICANSQLPHFGFLLYRHGSTNMDMETPGNPPLGAPHSWRLFRIFQPRSGCFPSMAVHLTKRLVPGFSHQNSW